VPRLARKKPADPASPTKKPAPTSRAPKTEAPKAAAAPRKRREKKEPYNDETMRVIREAKEGKSLRRYKNADDMFKDFGVK
jgi:hypothetical protein